MQNSFITTWVEWKPGVGFDHLPIEDYNLAAIGDKTFDLTAGKDFGVHGSKDISSRRSGEFQQLGLSRIIPNHMGQDQLASEEVEVQGSEARMSMCQGFASTVKSIKHCRCDNKLSGDDKPSLLLSKWYDTWTTRL